MATINSISPDIRDFLLNRNLIPSSTLVENGLVSRANGLGFPVQTSNGNEYIVDQPTVSVLGESYRDINLTNNPYRAENNLEIEIIDSTNNNIENSQPVQYGINGVINSTLINESTTYRDFNLTKNLYIDESQQILAELTYRNPILGGQMGSYVDETNDIRLANTGANVVGSILSGNGVGVSSSGLVPNFDIRGSIAGRVLSAVGVINDTPIGIIGARELGFAIANNALFNAQEEINLNPVNLFNGGSLFNENFQITVPSSGNGIINIAERILGFERPTSQLDEASSINITNRSSSHQRNIRRISNTGKGQYRSLFGNLNANTFFKPNYSIGTGATREGVSNPITYLGTDGVYLDEFYDDEVNKVAKSSLIKSGFSEGFDETEAGFFRNQGWAGTNRNRDESSNPDEGNLIRNEGSLLSKTRDIFLSDRVGTITRDTSTPQPPSQISSTVSSGADFVISKGSGVVGYSNSTINGDGTLSYVRDDDANTMFCRTWTSTKRYETINDLQKNSSLNTYGDTRRNFGDSVLDDNGQPKIAPYESDGIGGNIKKFMFSIENLAWADNNTELPPCELGNGDLTSGTKGRIMWFPPYDIDFTDNTSVSWDTTNFIGRGEPIYTYNNTERAGTLTFKVIIDNPSNINDVGGISGVNDELYASIVAGCANFDERVTNRMTPAEVSEVNVNNNVIPEQVVVTTDVSYEDVSIFFSNDSAIINEEYENGDDVGLGTTFGETTNSLGATFDDETDFGLNEPFFSRQADELRTFLRDECPACSIEIRGFASTHGNPITNQELSDNRSANVRQYFLDNILEPNDPNRDRRIVLVSGEGETGPTLTDSDPRSLEGAKMARKVEVKIRYNSSLDSNIQNVKPKESPQDPASFIRDEVAGRFIDECEYFEEMEKTTPFIYKSLKEKFRYFHPGFHSTTPEGLNSRLTFLQQCTRQGTTGDGVTQPNNLAFGKPPVCILRIGDFYHTKIIIDNLNFSYEPLVWDLNPEGVGVQPMIVTVDLSFKFIGGSSLSGPINKLQNALSFNYFANTEIYDKRSDILRQKTVDELEVNPNGTHTIEDGFRPNQINSSMEQQDIVGLNNNPNVPPIDQMVRNENENGNNVGDGTNTPTPKTDIDIINALQFFDVTLDNNNNLTYSYRVDGMFSETDGLSRTHNISFNIINSDNGKFTFENGILSTANGNEAILASGLIALFRNNTVHTNTRPNNLGFNRKEGRLTLEVKIGNISKKYPITI